MSHLKNNCRIISKKIAALLFKNECERLSHVYTLLYVFFPERHVAPHYLNKYHLCPSGTVYQTIKERQDFFPSLKIDEGGLSGTGLPVFLSQKFKKLKHFSGVGV